MNAIDTHQLPPLLATIAEYTVDQPNIDQLKRAMSAAGTILQLRAHGSALEREVARQAFIRAEGEARDPALVKAALSTAAQVSFGDPAFFYGLACCWLFLQGKDGAR